MKEQAELVRVLAVCIEILRADLQSTLECSCLLDADRHPIRSTLDPAIAPDVRRLEAVIAAAVAALERERAKC
ncbi:MAG TPA: hypothetical protein VM554_12990 [Acidisarcina sp.]|nr:hypothetical protein [Acidisarcina sp.]